MALYSQNGLRINIILVYQINNNNKVLNQARLLVNWSMQISIYSLFPLHLCVFFFVCVCGWVYVCCVYGCVRDSSFFLCISICRSLFQFLFLKVYLPFSSKLLCFFKSAYLFSASLLFFFLILFILLQTWVKGRRQFLKEKG